MTKSFGYLLASDQDCIYKLGKKGTNTVLQQGQFHYIAFNSTAQFSASPICLLMPNLRSSISPSITKRTGMCMSSSRSGHILPLIGQTKACSRTYTSQLRDPNWCGIPWRKILQR